MDISSGAFWTGLGSIVLADVVLSGDNAVVIAMAARSLPARQQKMAILWGSGAAIVMRVFLTVLAVEMLRWPYLKVVGAVLLLCIGISLFSEDTGSDGGHRETGSLSAAIGTILMADATMSLDNVLAVAAASKGNTPLLVIGLALSIPLIIFGSTFVLKLMERWPSISMAGAALLGFLAGEMMLSDPAVIAYFGARLEGASTYSGVVGAVIVVAVGYGMQARSRSRRAAK